MSKTSIKNYTLALLMKMLKFENLLTHAITKEFDTIISSNASISKVGHFRQVADLRAVS